MKAILNRGVRNLILTITIQWVKVAFKLIKLFTLENICSLRKSLIKSLEILES